LRLVAEHADIWHSFATRQTYPRKSDVLAQHCAAGGRDPATIARSTAVSGDTVDALIAEAEALVGLGVTLLTVGTGGPDYDLSSAEALCRWRDSR
jgi:alkanesulfonate monooxygenase SsuD/methylene tetrahydromethanopterin reductase-like flavin-dependent oxidoreductase (luciferase family)